MKRIKGILHAMSESIHDTCYIWWLEMKNTFKDEGVLIFFILVPLGYPILYSWIYNNERVHDVPVAVVDNSHSQLSRELLRRVDASPDVRVAYYCNNLQEAHDLIGKEAANGVLYIPSDFEQKIGRGEQSHLSVYCDMSMMLTYKAIYQTAQTVATEINSEIQKPKSMSTTERDEEINTEPLVCDAVQIFNPTGGYGNFLLPGVLVLILQQTLLLGIGLSAGTARENNRYRDLVPVSRHYNGIFRIVCGKSMCYFMIYMVARARDRIDCQHRRYGIRTLQPLCHHERLTIATLVNQILHPRPLMKLSVIIAQESYEEKHEGKGAQVDPE